jgi:hypothetical protein
VVKPFPFFSVHVHSPPPDFSISSITWFLHLVLCFAVVYSICSLFMLWTEFCCPLHSTLSQCTLNKTTISSNVHTIRSYPMSCFRLYALCFNFLYSKETSSLVLLMCLVTHVQCVKPHKHKVFLCQMSLVMVWLTTCLCCWSTAPMADVEASVTSARDADGLGCANSVARDKLALHSSKAFCSSGVQVWTLDSGTGKNVVKWSLDVRCVRQESPVEIQHA